MIDATGINGWEMINATGIKGLTATMDAGLERQVPLVPWFRLQAALEQQQALLDLRHLRQLSQSGNGGQGTVVGTAAPSDVENQADGTNTQAGVPLVSPGQPADKSLPQDCVPKDLVPMWDESLLDSAPSDAKLPTNVHRKYLRRCEIKVFAKGSSAADMELIHAIKAVVTKTKESDKDLMILPYSQADAALKPIMGVKDIPETIGKLKKYFQNASPRTHSRSYFLRVLMMAYTIPFAELTEDLK